ncbi:hypothetical protein [Lapillicoccus sp.]|uniref:hypothetical protein n=1 Tax=Lapillicoccus sp. TaxID=1909287 RepID=UPI003263EFE9
MTTTNRDTEARPAERADPLPDEVTVRVEAEGQVRELTATGRIDTPAAAAAYFQHGGILRYVLRQMLQN